ncbi:MAG: transferrin-binding protein-like solute binding protein [Chloroflexi bacterium]|nr:transferrin-binding protein-like solute binding protein [Chloroflexota bacterium]
MTGNGFSDGNGIVHGSFYGPGHEEIAGVLDDRSDSASLIAGFGGTR